MHCNFYFAPEAFSKLPDYDAAYDTEAYIRNQVNTLRQTTDKSTFGRIPTYRVFFDNTRVKRGRRLLDVGCGVGRFCHAAYAAGYLVTGIDISKVAVDIGSEYAMFPILCESIENIAARKLSFDAVTAFEVLEHLAAPLEFLQHVKPLLSHEGEFFFTVPNWDCPTIRTATTYDAIPPFHINFFTQTACRALLQTAGFNSVRTGVIYVDRVPRKIRSFPRWIIRRITKKPHNLGVWGSGCLR